MKKVAPYKNRKAKDSRVQAEKYGSVPSFRRRPGSLRPALDSWNGSGRSREAHRSCFQPAEFRELADTLREVLEGLPLPRTKRLEYSSQSIWLTRRTLLFSWLQLSQPEIEEEQDPKRAKHAGRNFAFFRQDASRRRSGILLSSDS